MGGEHGGEMVMTVSQVTMRYDDHVKVGIVEVLML